VGGHAAEARTPLDRGIGEADAVLAHGKFLDALAALTLLNHCMATTAVESAAALVHEKAVLPLFYGFTKHEYHILS